MATGLCPKDMHAHLSLVSDEMMACAQPRTRSVTELEKGWAEMVQGARVYEMLVLPMPTMCRGAPQHNNKEWFGTPSLVDRKQMGLCCGEQRIAWASRHGHTSIAGPCEDVRGKIKRGCNAGEKGEEDRLSVVLLLECVCIGFNR